MQSQNGDVDCENRCNCGRLYFTIDVKIYCRINCMIDCSYLRALHMNKKNSVLKVGRTPLRGGLNILIESCIIDTTQ